MAVLYQRPISRRVFISAVPENVGNSQLSHRRDEVETGFVLVQLYANHFVVFTDMVDLGPAAGYMLLLVTHVFEVVVTCRAV
jgi:hypothetical protein